MGAFLPYPPYNPPGQTTKRKLGECQSLWTCPGKRKHVLKSSLSQCFSLTLCFVYFMKKRTLSINKHKFAILNNRFILCTFNRTSFCTILRALGQLLSVVGLRGVSFSFMHTGELATTEFCRVHTANNILLTYLKF